MSKQARIPVSVKGSMKILYKFTLLESLFFGISLVLGFLIFKNFGESIFSFTIGIIEVITVTSLGYFRWPKGSQVYPSGMKIYAVAIIQIRKKFVHKGIYSRAYAFEKNRIGKDGKSRLLEKERY